MRILLIVIAILAYLFGFLAWLLGGTVLQGIQAGIAFVCGTVALAGVGVIGQLEDIKNKLKTP
jgi:hypothetical protein